MAETSDRLGGEYSQAETAPQGGMTADPVVRTALLVRRMRKLGAELRDIPGAKRDLIVKMWSRAATPAEIARATELPVTRIDRILGLRASKSAPSTWGGASNGVEG